MISHPVGAVFNRARAKGRAYNARLPKGGSMIFHPIGALRFPPVGAVSNRARARGRAYNARLPKGVLSFSTR